MLFYKRNNTLLDFSSPAPKPIQSSTERRRGSEPRIDLIEFVLRATHGSRYFRINPKCRQDKAISVAFYIINCYFAGFFCSLACLYVTKAKAERPNAATEVICLVDNALKTADQVVAVGGVNAGADKGTYSIKKAVKPS